MNELQLLGPRAYGEALGTAVLKACAEDFQVDEVLDIADEELRFQDDLIFLSWILGAQNGGLIILQSSFVFPRVETQTGANHKGVGILFILIYLTFFLILHAVRPDYAHKIFPDLRDHFFLLMETLAMRPYR